LSQADEPEKFPSHRPFHEYSLQPQLGLTLVLFCEWRNADEWQPTAGLLGLGISYERPKNIRQIGKPF
jgi:hypothetical protein